MSFPEDDPDPKDEEWERYEQELRWWAHEPGNGDPFEETYYWKNRYGEDKEDNDFSMLRSLSSFFRRIVSYRGSYGKDK